MDFKKLMSSAALWLSATYNATLTGSFCMRNRSLYLLHSKKTVMLYRNVIFINGSTFSNAFSRKTSCMMKSFEKNKARGCRTTWHSFVLIICNAWTHSIISWCVRKTGGLFLPSVTLGPCGAHHWGGPLLVSGHWSLPVTVWLALKPSWHGRLTVKQMKKQQNVVR